MGGMLALTLALSYSAVSGQANSSSQARMLHAALKACEKHKLKSQRQACEKKARRRYRTRSGPSTKTIGERRSTTTPKHPPTHETPTEELVRARNDRTPPVPTPGGIAFGQELFATDCASCHGPHGEGTGTGPNLITAPQAQTNIGVMEELISPPPGGMPNFEETLGFLEKEAVADFVTVEITRTEETIL